MTRIVVTGANGFIAKNLRVRLGEAGHKDIATVTRETSAGELCALLASADFVFHLAGVNRPPDASEFDRGNRELTETICATLADSGRRTPIAFASSTQAMLGNPYGESKRAAEEAIERYGAATGAPVFVLRLTNVFGKWSRPNYNSAVATFCHNLARGMPITVNDPAAPLSLVYVDDVISALISLLAGKTTPGFVEVGPVFRTTVGDVAETIRRFVSSRQTLIVPEAGGGLTRALHATYLSFLPPADFAFPLRAHSDPRGRFVEMLRTSSSGQVSYFTAYPGITRGEHYHHTKTERFLVVRGRARFGFRHVVTGETHEILADGADPRIVETVPGWVHNITNVGDEEMLVMLWANEVFDPEHPDTIAVKVDP